MGPYPYISATEYAEREGISIEAARKRLRLGKVDGALRLGDRGAWRIPNPDFIPADPPRRRRPVAASTPETPLGLATDLIAHLERNPTRSARAGSMAVAHSYRLLDRHRNTPGGWCAECLNAWPCDAADTAHTVLVRFHAILVEGDK